MSEHAHAQRRTPTSPEGAVRLEDAGKQLLDEARSLNAGRSARTLTPEVGVTLKQTLMAILEGRKLDKHRAPTRATIQVLQGSVTITAESETLDLEQGDWAMIPEDEHDLLANNDALVLLTVGKTAGD